MISDNKFCCPASFKERVHTKFDSNDQNAIVFKPHSFIPNPVTDCHECSKNAYRELQSDLTKLYSKRYQDLDEKIQRYKIGMLDLQVSTYLSDGTNRQINSDSRQSYDAP